MRFTSVIMVLAGLACTGHAGAADTLAKIKANGEIRLGYFAASAPFSYVGTDKSPQGYSVELCQRIAASVQRELGLAQLKTTWVELGLGDRIEAVRGGRIDIECGTTSWSFSRQQLVDFSLMTFIDGASLLATVDSGIKRITDAGGKRISVIRGTTPKKRSGVARQGKSAGGTRQSGHARTGLRHADRGPRGCVCVRPLPAAQRVHVAALE